MFIQKATVTKEAIKCTHISKCIWHSSVQQLTLSICPKQTKRYSTMSADFCRHCLIMCPHEKLKTFMEYNHSLVSNTDSSLIVTVWTLGFPSLTSLWFMIPPSPYLLWEVWQKYQAFNSCKHIFWSSLSVSQNLKSCVEISRHGMFSSITYNPKYSLYRRLYTMKYLVISAHAQSLPSGYHIGI